MFFQALLMQGYHYTLVVIVNHTNDKCCSITTYIDHRTIKEDLQRATIKSHIQKENIKLRNILKLRKGNVKEKADYFILFYFLSLFIHAIYGKISMDLIVQIFVNVKFSK